MVIRKFEEIIAWQRARELTNLIYRKFFKLHDFEFRKQICRASVSIMNNVAEGYERMGNKEFIKFLFISKGSCSEVRSMLYLARDLDYITEHNFTVMQEKVTEVSKMIYGLIKYLKNNNFITNK